jgi:hypothetical protein
MKNMRFPNARNKKQATPAPACPTLRAQLYATKFAGEICYRLCAKTLPELLNFSSGMFFFIFFLADILKKHIFAST